MPTSLGSSNVGMQQNRKQAMQKTRFDARSRFSIEEKFNTFKHHGKI